MVTCKVDEIHCSKKSDIEKCLGHKISEIHYQNSENYENIELTGLNNLSKVAFIW